MLNKKIWRREYRRRKEREILSLILYREHIRKRVVEATKNFQ